MKRNYFVPVVFALFLFVSSPVVGYSLNVHSSNVQKENVPMLSINGNTNVMNKDISQSNRGQMRGNQINRGQIRSRMVHVRNNIRQFLKRFDILGLF
jgi:hypothetical protein